ncbi:hypothetical protein SAY86_026472 [Trapa natans]|uniref:RING-type E3 ubiquitin transferase n=1 Tax=Trapa natans TaxID=22666 RepID=A0AAN7KLS0_TRANT|nr:hypothetical protein SAY86_026472 [Trapa natans]
MSWEMACVVFGAALFLGTLCTIIARHFHKRNTNRNPTGRDPTGGPPILFDTREDFVDEEQHGPQLDHPIWYIRTVGLDKSVIDSIAVFRYKAGEGLIDGTECPVCLNEFRDEDTLRLLPKCSHAFHVPCIDTWLQSHKNCPLCRAPIVGEGGTLQVQVQASPEEEEPRAADLHARDIGESSRSIGPSPSPIGEVGESENGIEEEEEGGKVLALTDHGGNGEIQPVRRSFSIDSPASEIYRAVAIAMQDQSPDRLKKQAMKIKSFSVISTQHIFRGYGSRRSASLFKMVKSCSFRTALGKDPINMKRLAPKSSSSSSSDDNHGKRSVARAVKS